MAVDFDLRRFCHYLIGGPQVNIITNHKPLFSMFYNKRLQSLHLDWIKLRHQSINFKLTRRKGVKIPGDYASRHIAPKQNSLNIYNKNQRSRVNCKLCCWFLHQSPYIECLSVETLHEHLIQDEILQNFATYYGILKCQ